MSASVPRLQVVVCLAAGVVLASTVGAATVARLAARATPVAVRFDDTRAAYCPSDLRLLDRRGDVLHEVRLDETRRRLRWTPLDRISPALRAAVLASEDRRFFEHGGVDVRALAAAAWQRARGGTLRGASTITMQLAALLDPSLARGGAPRGLQEKWRQMLAARALEASWSKEQILEAYLNLVSFRGELQGVAAASAVLFGREPHGLSDAQAAMLASLLRAPNASRDAVTVRARRLLAGDGADGVAAMQAAVDQAFDSPRGSGPRTADAAHAARLLLGSHEREACADRGSTLDADVQRFAAESLDRHLREIADRSARDGAVLVVDNATGEVLAYVASSGPLSAQPHVDGIRARRQAGSTLKPFLYGLALERRLVTAGTLLEDTPADVPLGDGVFRPRNYDRVFHGLVSVRSALAASLNVPAVRTLQLTGTDRFADLLRALGMSGIDHDGEFYGPSLALGSAEVSLWELTAAYRALARGGVWSEPAMTPGQAAEERHALGEDAAFVVGDILSDRAGRALTFGFENVLSTRFWTAVKTGTSKDMRDNWCVGYSSRYTVGVWVGNFTGAPMHDVSGVTGAGPVWNEVMTYLHRDEPSTAPAAPAGLVRARSGDHDEWFVRGTEPVAAASVVASLPRIVSPPDGSILTVDLDTPPERQRLAFLADAAPAGARWRIGMSEYAASEPVLWPPIRGRHRLSLRDANDAELAAVTFEVRRGAGGTVSGLAFEHSAP